jgi:hypothetical protein
VVQKSSSKIWATFLFLQKLPKENNRPLGENSPNLVALIPAKNRSRIKEWLFLTDVVEDTYLR